MAAMTLTYVHGLRGDSDQVVAVADTVQAELRH